MHCLAGDTYKHWDDGLQLAAGCESGETMEIPLGVGKPLRTTWTDDHVRLTALVSTGTSRLRALYMITKARSFVTFPITWIVVLSHFLTGVHFSLR